MAGVGHTQDTVVGDEVLMTIPNQGPYGISVGPDKQGKGLIIVSWERLPGGRFGEIQKNKGVHIGDCIYKLNDCIMHRVAHKEAAKMLNDGNILKKKVVFINEREYYERKCNESTGTGLNISSSSAGANFTSVFRATRINRDLDTKTSHAEYEIACQMRTSSTRLHKDNVHK